MYESQIWQPERVFLWRLQMIARHVPWLSTTLRWTPGNGDLIRFGTAIMTAATLPVRHIALPGNMPRPWCTTRRRVCVARVDLAGCFRPEIRFLLRFAMFKMSVSLPEERLHAGCHILESSDMHFFTNRVGPGHTYHLARPREPSQHHGLHTGSVLVHCKAEKIM